MRCYNVPYYAPGHFPRCLPTVTPWTLVQAVAVWTLVAVVVVVLAVSFLRRKNGA